MQRRIVRHEGGWYYFVQGRVSKTRCIGYKDEQDRMMWFNLLDTQVTNNHTLPRMLSLLARFTGIISGAVSDAKVDQQNFVVGGVIDFHGTAMFRKQNSLTLETVHTGTLDFYLARHGGRVGISLKHATHGSILEKTYTFPEGVNTASNLEYLLWLAYKRTGLN